MRNDSNSQDAPMKPGTGMRRSWLGWFLWVTTVGGLYFIRHEVEERDVETLRSQQAIASMMERADKTLSALDSSKVVDALAQQEKNLRTLQTRMEADANSLAEALKQQKDVNGRMLASLGPEGGNIDDALKLAEEAKSAGNSELALVYLANAIRNQPRDTRLLEKYTAWVVEGKNPAVMQGAENLLQSALYGVAAKDVVEVAKRLEEVTNARVAMEKNVEVPNGTDPTVAESLAALDKVPFESVSEDRKMVEARLVALSAILERIEEADQPNSELRVKVNQRMEQAQACGLAHQVIDLATLHFSNLESAQTLLGDSSSENNRNAALSALQATEAAVNQVWSVPFVLLTPELHAKLIVLPTKLKAEAAKIQDSIGKVDVQMASEAWKKRPNQDSGIIQNRIVGCKSAIEACSELLGKVQGPKSRKEAANLYAEMAGEMKKLQEQQLIAYQNWAVTQIEAARLRYESAKALHWDKDAFAGFYETDFQTIDQRFLTPDVDQFLQSVFSILCNKLNAEGKAELQRQMAFPSPPHQKRKRALESF